MDRQRIAEIVSLFLTSPAIMISVAVMFHYGVGTWKIISSQGSWNPFRWKLTYDGWMVVGVFLSFLGKTTDNSYWAIPWSLSYVESPLTMTFFNMGVYFNIPDRQCLSILAGVCHLHSFYVRRFELHGKPSPLRKIIHWSLVLGLIHVWGLTWIKFRW